MRRWRQKPDLSPAPPPQKGKTQADADSLKEKAAPNWRGLCHFMPGAYFSALSVIAMVKAPVGSLVITGSDPPPSKVATVRL